MPYLAAALPYISAAAAVGGAALSYNASVQQAQQSKMNADAQARALTMEAERQSQETQQAQLRTAQNQQRFRAQQETELTGNGFVSSTGSPLSIMADTYAASQRDLGDIGYQGATNRWGLQNSAQAAQAQGYSQAGAIMGQAGGTLLSNAGSIASQGYRTFGKSGYTGN
jgi:hypothetical protein